MNLPDVDSAPDFPSGPFFSRHNFKLALASLDRLQRLIFLALGIAAASFLVFFFHPELIFSTAGGAALGFLEHWLKVVGHSPLLLFLFIFINNLVSMYIYMLLGIFLTIPSLISLIVNGAIGGAVVRLAMEQSASALPILYSLPHAVIELPAYIISMALGIMLGLTWFRGDLIINLKRNLRFAHVVFVYLLIPLIFTAAIIETAAISIFK